MNPFEKTCCHYKLTKDDDIHTLNMSNNVSATLYNIINFQTESDRFTPRPQSGGGDRSQIDSGEAGSDPLCYSDSDSEAAAFFEGDL